MLILLWGEAHACRLFKGGILMTHNWQKFKSTFFKRPCHEIGRVEAVNLSLFN